MTQLQESSHSQTVHAPLPNSIKSSVLIATCLALFMTNFDGTAGDVALPQIQTSFGADMAGVQWFLNAYHLPVASLLLISGKFGDAFGRKRIFLSGLVVFTLASILCGLAPSLTALTVARSLQGIGAAALIPLSLTMLTATFTDEQSRTKAIGIWSAVSALALVAGPGLGGLLVDALSWRSIFFVNVPLGVVTFFLTVKAFQEAPATSDQALDWRGLGLSALTISLLAYSLTYSSTDAWLSLHRAGLFGLAMLSFGSFLVSQFYCDRPVIPRTLLKNRRFLTVCVVQTLVFFMSGGLFFILSLFLQHIQGYSATMTGLCFLPMNAAIIAASFASGWIAAKQGWRFPILTGLAIVAVSIVSLTGINTGTAYGEIVSKLVLAGFGGGLTIPTLAATAMNAVPRKQEGIASAISSISIQLGGILGIALQGAVFSQRLRENLEQSLNKLSFPESLSNEVLADALRSLSELPQNLPVPPTVLQEAIRSAFVLGLQAVLWTAATAIVVGIGLIVIVSPKQSHSNF